MTKQDANKELLADAVERFKLCEEAWDENRKAAIEAMNFRIGKQWPDDIAAAREKQGRPCLVVDKLQQYIRQVVNDGRQNRPQVKVRPVDDYGDKDVAEIYQGVIRHIWDRSSADEATDTALDNAVTGGFGFIRVLTEYAHDKTFDQEICIARVRNPLSCYLDPNAVKADGSDAMFGFVEDQLPKKSFKKQYPNAKKANWNDDGGAYAEGWIAEENVRIVEYFWKEEVAQTLLLLEDGTTCTQEEYDAAQEEGIPVPEVMDSRTVIGHKVMWAKMTGAEVLEQREWPGKYIPLVPVYGNEYDIEGKVILTGLIKPAMDAQRLYNYSRSAFAERVALTPKAPYIAAAGQVEAYPEWETANTENHSVLRYDPIDVNGTPVGAPQRQPASDIPSGFAQDMQLSEHDIQAAIGMYNASLGAKSNEKSGKAILARQREGDVATFHYQDNLNRAIRHLGRILVDLIPKIYDSKRIVRILGEDGTPDQVQLDPTLPVAKQEIGDGKAIYNLNVGTYDVSVSAGPSYTTKRQEAADAMMELTRSNPATFGLIGDLLVKAMDWPGAEDIAKRLKAMLPPQIQQAEETEEAPQIPPQFIQAVEGMQQHIAQMEQAIAEREQAIAELASKAKTAEEKNEIEERKVEIDAYKAETERMKALSESMSPEAVQQIVLSTLQQLMTTPDISQPEEPEAPEIPEMETEQPPEGGFFTPEEAQAVPQFPQQ